MRIGVVGNLANVGYELVRALDELGEHARLIAPRDRLEAWRRVVDGPPEDDRLLDLVPAGPHWTPWTVAALRRYDVLVSVCLSGTPALPFLGRPYVSYSTGADLRELAMSAPIYPRYQAMAARRTFRSAAIVLHSLDNPVLDAVQQLGLQRVRACRHFVDLAYWRATPPPPSSDDDLVVVAPANLHWVPDFPGQSMLKRNDILFAGFARFLETGGRGRLVVLRRGPQASELDDVLGRLNLRGTVEVIDGGLDRQALRALFGRAHVIGDQFSPEGGLGVIAIEALTAGRPLLTSRADAVIAAAYGDDSPPASWAGSPDEVAAQLHVLRDASTRSTLGESGASWAARQHDRRTLATWYRDIIRDAATN
jgi:glycosyltransferase involved in cell wall biosynthesis